LLSSLAVKGILPFKKKLLDTPFQLAASSKGFDIEKQVNASTVNSAKINFRLGKGLKKC